MHIVIIGSGLAGLTAGAALSKAGHQVSIFEHYAQPGGVTAPYEKEGFRWDLGQLLIEGLGADEPLGNILAELGVLSKIQVKVDERRYVFPDFEINKPKDYAGLRWRIDYLKAQFPEDAAGLERYWKDYLRFTGLHDHRPPPGEDFRLIGITFESAPVPQAIASPPQEGLECKAAHG